MLVVHYEIVVSRLDSIDVPSLCNPHDLAKVIARASRGMDYFREWVVV